MDKVIFDVRRKMVLDFIEEKNYKPMKFKELCMVFSVPKREKEEFKEFLDQLIAGGELTLTENGRYKKAEPDTFTGKFCGSTRGFGFVTVEGMERDVFIPADETKGAFHGDTVLIQLVAPAVPAGGTRAAKRAEGKVLQIVERGFTEVIGIFQKNFFRHCRPITIPAIPSHGRSFCKYIFIHVYFSSSSQNKCQVSHCSIINTLRVSYLTLILFHFILILSQTILHTLPAALSPVIFHLQLHTCNLRLTDKSL